MSGGISAIRGFDYQATVILELLFDHFDQHGQTALVRPEGVDDLDLYWSTGEKSHRRFIQVKKPRDDANGERKPSPWSLSDAINELFPNTIAHLIGNNHEQIWIVGDEVANDLSLLVDEGLNAPISTGDAYWKVIHTLARNDAVCVDGLAAEAKNKLSRKRISKSLPSDPASALASISNDFESFATNCGAGNSSIALYRQRVTELHANLPDILARTKIRSFYGTEEEVIKRVHDRLEQQYSLPRPVIENTLFRNLRGFISDISKQPDRAFDSKELEFELRSVWPMMIYIKEPPMPGTLHIRRHDLVEKIVIRPNGKAIEVIGISGSGKTTLAAEALQHAKLTDDSREVYYSEVRPDVSLRDVLVGVAYHLRRLGIAEPFSIAVDTAATNEDVLAKLAQIFGIAPKKILLLIDLVDGNCTPSFARDLSTFVRSLPSGKFQLAIFGQESSLRDMTLLERKQIGVEQLNMRGFNIDEFMALAKQRHPNPDYATLSNVFQRVTAGRAAGMFAKLAQSLASVDSLQEMIEISEMPPDDMLPYAEKQRFSRVSDASRQTAEKLLCFALPFLRIEADEVFPDDNVGAAISEMLTLGLLRPNEDGSFEMHETVRAGLESSIAPNVRHSAHEGLAAWYDQQGAVTAAIFHLDKAAKHEEACQRARQAFLQGENWGALSAYVVDHRLVSAQEIFAMIAGPNQIKEQYLLSDILPKLGDLTTCDELFRMLREQPQRFHNDYSWASAITSSILKTDCSKFNELIQLALQTMSLSDQGQSAFLGLSLDARHFDIRFDATMLELFKHQPPEIKKHLIPIMLLDRRREVLQQVFQFVLSNPEVGKNSRRAFHSSLQYFRFENIEEVIAFLAAMPSVDSSQMMTAKSVMIGFHASFISSQRKVLRTRCLEIIKENAWDDYILVNAVRVLIFIAEPTIFSICNDLATRKQSLAWLVMLVPAITPAFCDRSIYEQQIFDQNLAFDKRIVALHVLAELGADLGSLYRSLKATEKFAENEKLWNYMFLMECVQHPFAGAIPLLQAALNETEDKNNPLLFPSVIKLGELPVPEATTLLLQALSHPDSRIRQVAAQMLGQRRSRSSLSSLSKQLAREDEQVISLTLAVSIIASAPSSVADISAIRFDSPKVKLWQCILAMRTRDSSMAEQLVTLACDPTQNWQIRRAAIFAAGRLPYEAALERIAPIVLGERSPFVIDKNADLLSHNEISWFLLNELPLVFSIYTEGKESFVSFWGELFDTRRKEYISSQDVPLGADAASWLFERLHYHGWPVNRQAPDLVVCELHIPILHAAVLRSLRLCGCAELIEEQISHSYHVWFTVKCIKERTILGADNQIAARLKSLVAASTWKDHWLPNRVIDERCGVHQANSTNVPPVVVAPAKAMPSASYIQYDEVVMLLAGASSSFQTSQPFVVTSLTETQCEHLINLLAPINDPSPGVEKFVPSIRFVKDGHVVAQRQVSYTGNDKSIYVALRVAVAAANKFGLNIPWHNEQLTGFYPKEYIKKFLECLGAQDNSDRFYEELAKEPDALMHHICETTWNSPILKYVDPRIIPFLNRYVSSGTDEFFEGLCSLTLRIESPEIDVVLAGLFYRWVQKFNVKSRDFQHHDNHHLWRGFARLAEHPRFNQISAWPSRLTAVLQANIAYYHMQEIARVLERDPRSYIQIEKMLFRYANFQHYYRDEVDRLDEAAERLFHVLLEN